MSKDACIEIVSGADKTSVFRLRNPKTGDPLNLTGFSKICLKFKKRDRTDLLIDTVTIPAVKASATVDGVTISADISGSAGNDVILQFDGVDDVDTVVGAWNLANPGNPISHNGAGTEVISAQTVRLDGGYNAYAPVEIVGDAQLGKIRFTLLESQTEALKRGPNQNIVATVDFGTNPGGQRIKGFFNRLNVIADD